VAPLAAACGAWWLVAEERSRLDVRQLTRAAHGLLAGLRSRELWLLAGFLLCYYFSPGFNVPLYYHLTDNLQFPQAYIGVLGSFTAAGSIAGALVYRWWFSDLSAKRLLQLSIVLGAASAASYLLLLGELSAAILSFGYGVATMIALVATLALAVDFCPRHSEGFIFAALMSVTNLAMVLSDNAGSFLYEHVLQRQIAPLVLVSAAFTSLALLLVPLLRLADTPRGGASPQQPAAT
jgi:predicted MFS family arabinose efflux permease